MRITSERKRFVEWEHTIPIHQRCGEWECDYPNWEIAYSAADEWLCNPNPNSVDDILYLIARDNESEHIVSLAQDHSNALSILAQASIESPHSDAKWQIAKVIASLPNSEKILAKLWNDKSYYTQRICMMESAKIKSTHTAYMIEWAWSTNDEYQRISALWSLYWSECMEIEPFLAIASQSKHERLRNASTEIRQLTSR